MTILGPACDRLKKGSPTKKPKSAIYRFIGQHRRCFVFECTLALEPSGRFLEDVIEHNIELDLLYVDILVYARTLDSADL